MNTSVLLHLHPQGAFVARAIDYCEAKINNAIVYPCFYPSFMDGYNREFAQQLKDDIDKSATMLSSKFMNDRKRWNANKEKNYDIIEKPKI